VATTIAGEAATTAATTVAGATERL